MRKWEYIFHTEITFDQNILFPLLPLVFAYALAVHSLWWQETRGPRGYPTCPVLTGLLVELTNSFSGARNQPRRHLFPQIPTEQISPSLAFSIAQSFAEQLDSSPTVPFSPLSTSTMTVILIVGATRGLGYSLAKTYASNPENYVLATARTSNPPANCMLSPDPSRSCLLTISNHSQEPSVHPRNWHREPRGRCKDSTVST